ncbi:MAG: DUF2860 family protein [Halothiobacillaceae bacterium]
MSLRRLCKGLGLSLLPSLFIGPAAAAPISPEKGFSGFVSVLPASVTTQSATHTGDDNRVLESLDSDGARERSAAVAAIGMLRYTLRPGQTELYFGTPPERVGEGTFQLELGIRQQLADGSRLRLGLIPFELLESRLWADPFVTGQARDKTRASNRGLRLGWSAIRGSQWSVDYTFLRHEVDREHSGRFLGLDAAEQALLRRDANRHQLTVDYRWQLSPRVSLRPALRYERIQAKGRAERADVLRPQVNLFWRDRKHQVSLTAYGAFSRYDARNPVFDQSRDARSWGLVAGYSLAEPFGWKNGQFNLFALGTRSDSDIRFYDSRTVVLAAGLGYRF